MDQLCPSSFAGVREFEDKWNGMVRRIAAEVADNLRRQLTQASLVGNNRLVWLDMDMITFGIPNVSLISKRTLSLLTEVVGLHNKEWCDYVNEELLENVCDVSRLYFDTTRHHSVQADNNFYVNIIEVEIMKRLGTLSILHNGLPFIWRSNCVLQRVFDCNFVSNVVSESIASYWSLSQESEIYCMILCQVRHQRQGLFSLKEEILLFILQSFCHDRRSRDTSNCPFLL